MESERGKWALRILQFFTKDEVKTPLAFLYKVVPYIAAILVIVLFAPVSEELKKTVILWSFIGLFGLAVAVLGCALWRPKHLVYGETGHRAEYKIDFGTESEVVDRAAIEHLPTSSNPDLPKLRHDL